MGKVGRLLWLGGLALMIVLASWTPALALTGDDGRKIIQDHQNAVVTVQLVIEMTSSYGGESDKRENKVTATGTVIDPSGLVVASLTETNPTEYYRQFMSEEDEDFKMSSRTVDARIKLADGTEILADVVLRDPDLDLAFIRPKKAPEKPLDFVDLTQGSAPQCLDELLVLSRMGVVGNRAIAANIDHVRAVVTKPRTLYVVTPYMHSGMGGPAFTMDGKPAGILLVKMSISKDQDRQMSSGMDDSMTSIVLPCSSIVAIAEQAKTAAAPKEEPKPAVTTKKPLAPVKTTPKKPAPK